MGMKYFVPVASGIKAVFETGSFVEALDLVNQFGEVILEHDLYPTVAIKAEFVTVEITSLEGEPSQVEWNLANALEATYRSR